MEDVLKIDLKTLFCTLYLGDQIAVPQVKMEIELKAYNLFLVILRQDLYCPSLIEDG